jgi:hypothetical protein
MGGASRCSGHAEPAAVAAQLPVEEQSAVLLDALAPFLTPAQKFRLTCFLLSRADRVDGPAPRLVPGSALGLQRLTLSAHLFEPSRGLVDRGSRLGGAWISRGPCLLGE